MAETACGQTGGEDQTGGEGGDGRPVMQGSLHHWSAEQRPIAHRSRWGGGVTEREGGEGKAEEGGVGCGWTPGVTLEVQDMCSGDEEVQDTPTSGCPLCLGFRPTPSCQETRRGAEYAGEVQSMPTPRCTPALRTLGHCTVPRAPLIWAQDFMSQPPLQDMPTPQRTCRRGHEEEDMKRTCRR